MRTAGYVAAWLAGAAVVAAIAIVLLDNGEPEDVNLPPIQGTELVDAARLARCELRRTRPRERTDPAVDGPAASQAAGAGFYDEAPETSTLVAALRRGLIVIHFRPDLDGERVDALREFQEAAPNGTIVTPNPTMAFEVAATAYRRLLGCPRASDASVEAALLFRGRFLGSGPEG